MKKFMAQKEGRITVPAYKDKEKNTWYISFYFTSWNGERVKKLKRGFQTKREALIWESNFIMQQNADLNMTFENFTKIYYKDKKDRLRMNTWIGKKAIIEKKTHTVFWKNENESDTA